MGPTLTKSCSTSFDCSSDGVYYFECLYFQVKDAGRYKEVERTQGVSTTDLVGRMLLLTRDHFQRGSNEYNVDKSKDDHSSTLATDSHARSPWTGMSQFLPTTRKIQQFSEGKAPQVFYLKLVKIMHGII